MHDKPSCVTSDALALYCDSWGLTVPGEAVPQAGQQSGHGRASVPGAGSMAIEAPPAQCTDE